MEAPEISPAEQSTESLAAQLINRVIDEVEQSGVQVSPEELSRRILEYAGLVGAPEDVQQKIRAYLTSLQFESRSAVIASLQPGVGGQYNGSGVEIATSTLTVDKSIAEAQKKIAEVDEHEAYHQQHGHTEQYVSGASAEGSTVVTIGGEEFSDKELIEGLTVAETGSTFVSEEYERRESKLEGAVARSDTSMDAVRDAINEAKDLRNIDDVDRTIAEVRGLYEDGPPQPQGVDAALAI